MITFIRGIIVEKNPAYVVVESGGIGYILHISLHTYSRIKDTDKEMKFYTHYHIREDAHTLYGFTDQKEREIFRHLISVSGVGTATARIVLSSMNPDEVRNCILTGDVARLKSVKGIGAKTAQRIIIDLKDKISKTAETEDFVPGTGNTNREETLSALDVLGFSRKQSQRIVDSIIRENPRADVQEIIKQALKRL